LDFVLLCIIPGALLGAIVGSFLNVVIFRLPRGMSIIRPPRSFCPHCLLPIRPLDNVPIASWLYLRGRCRQCQVPIAGAYPVIESVSALLFIMVWDVLFIARLVPAVASPAHDWPMALAYLSLFAGLLSLSGMDIESYIIDIRVCVFIMIAGIACHFIWGLPVAVLDPVAIKPTGALPPALCLIGAAMGLTWMLTALLRSRSASPPGADAPEQRDSDAPADVAAPVPAGAAANDSSAYTNTARQKFQPLPIAALCSFILILGGWQMFFPDYQPYRDLPAGGQRGFIACFLLMLLLVLASMVTRPSDDQIIEEIEADCPQARPTALRELAWFIPALAAGIGLLLLLRRSGDLGASWQDARQAAPGLGVITLHIGGALRAVGGLVFAAALGWTVRILGTLAFGKEAFGTGDIYIMAAIGAVAGFWMVVFAFFLGAILALLGVLLTLFRKRSRAIPFGPWLAMGAFAALWLQGLFLDLFGYAGSLLWSLIRGQPLLSTGG
jgi:prepilin signal peptidase PulO-like enzyme (type II secretory pathway)